MKFLERLNARLVKLGWTIENIRENVAKDCFLLKGNAHD